MVLQRLASANTRNDRPVLAKDRCCYDAESVLVAGWMALRVSGGAGIRPSLAASLEGGGWNPRCPGRNSR